METKKLTDRMHVGGQITPENVGLLRNAGFKTIICNRPDGEKPDQHDAETIRSLAEAAGIAYHHNPLMPDNLTPDIVAKQARLLSESEGPIFAHCATGRRSTFLWALANTEGLDAEERIRLAANAGYDITPLRPYL